MLNIYLTKVAQIVEREINTIEKAAAGTGLLDPMTGEIVVLSPKEYNKYTKHIEQHNKGYLKSGLIGAGIGGLIGTGLGAISGRPDAIRTGAKFGGGVGALLGAGTGVAYRQDLNHSAAINAAKSKK